MLPKMIGCPKSFSENVVNYMSLFIKDGGFLKRV